MKLPSIEDFLSLSHEEKAACLRRARDHETEGEDAIKAWLNQLLPLESDDVIRAALFDLLGVHIHEESVRATLSSLASPWNLKTASHQVLAALMIVAVSDELPDVRQWGQRLLLSQEGVDARDGAALAAYLCGLFTDADLSPYLRWHAVLSLADIDDPAAVNHLFAAADHVLKKFQDVELECDEDAAVEAMLSEKTAYSLGRAAEIIASSGKSATAVAYLDRIAKTWFADDEEKPRVISWAIHAFQGPTDDPPPSTAVQKNRGEACVQTSSRFGTILQWLSRIHPPKLAAIAISAILVFGAATYWFMDGTDRFAFTFDVIAYEGKAPFPSRGQASEYRSFEVRNNGVLSSGSYFKIRYQGENDAYVHVIFHDSSGQFAAFNYGRLPGGQPHLLSESGDGFQLDNATGVETIFVIASPEVIPDFDQKYQRLQKQGPGAIKDIFSNAQVEDLRFRHED